MKTTENKHSQEINEWIRRELKARGVDEFKYCTFNSNYVCDKYGNIYSICKENKTGKGVPYKQYRFLPIHGSVEDGYVTFRMDVNGKRKHVRGHRIIAEAWLGPCPGMVVNHIDGDKLNNALSNLEWCSIAENNEHAIKTGLYDPRAMDKRVYSLPKEEWVSVYVLHKHCGFSFRELGQRNRCSRGAIETIYRKMDELFMGVTE